MQNNLTEIVIENNQYPQRTKIVKLPLTKHSQSQILIPSPPKDLSKENLSKEDLPKEELPKEDLPKEELQKKAINEMPLLILDCSMTLEDIFINLRLISKIEIGDKLVHNNKYINIDTSLVPSISRWYKNMNRNNNIAFINNILNNAKKYNNNLVGENTDDSVLSLFRLTNELKTATNGLINLKQTYTSDKLVQSELDVIIENIRLIVDSNSKNIKFLNKYNEIK
jgi:hypothetical protein